MKRESSCFRSTRTSSVAANEQLRSTQKKTANLALGKEYADEVLSRSTESTKGSPDFPQFYPPSKARKERDGLGDETQVAGGGAVPLLAFARPATWLFRPNHSHIPDQKGTTMSTNGSRNDDALPLAVGAHQQATPTRDNKKPLVTHSPTIPVKCPPRTKSKTFHSHEDLLHPSSDLSSSFMDPEESDHLQQLYDMRTWDMYLRITEARKNRTTTTASTSADRRRAPGEHGYATQQEQHPRPRDTMIPTGTATGPTLPPSQIEISDYGHFAGIDEPESHFSVPAEVGGHNTSHEMIFGDLE